MAKKQKKDEAAQPEVEVEQAPSFTLVDERDSMLDKYYSEKDQESQEVESETDGEIPQITDEPEKEPAEVSDHEPEGEVEPTEPDKVAESKLQQDYENLKGSLTEEREKRKRYADENRDLQAKLTDVLKGFKEVNDELQQLKAGRSDDSDYRSEYDEPNEALLKEIKSMRQEIQDLKQDRATRDKRSQEKIRQERIESVHKKLEGEGFPFFKLNKSAITEELESMLDDEPSEREQLEILRKWDNPMGWEKIYKERIWPKYYGKHIEETTQKKTVSDKKEAKKKAKLVTVPGGKTPESNEDDKEWSYDDYLKIRRQKQIS